MPRNGDRHRAGPKTRFVSRYTSRKKKRDKLHTLKKYDKEALKRNSAGVRRPQHHPD